MLLLLLSHFSRVQLCDPIDGSPPGSPVPGILQAGTLEWAASSFSNAWKWKVKAKSLSRVRLLATPWTTAYQSPPSMGFSRQEYWSGVPLPSPLTMLTVYLFFQKIFIKKIPCTKAKIPLLNSVLEEWYTQFSSVTQSCPTLCDPMNRSMPGLPVHHHFPEFTQTHVHRISDAIQPPHPLSSPSPPAPNSSQHQSLFQWVSSSHEVAKLLEFQLQHHSLQRNPRAHLLQNGLVGSPCNPRDSQESSPTPQFKSINSLALSLLYSPALTSIHDHRKNHTCRIQIVL